MTEIAWVPLRGVDTFEFGSPIQPYLEDGLLLLDVDPSDQTGWDSYDVVGADLRLYAENDIVVAILCQDSCVLNGCNLIDRSFDDVKRLLGCEPTERRDDQLLVGDDRQEVYEFENLGAQIWVKASTREVAAIICSGPDEGEAED